jgi:threonine/homoserine/homoserine lactone efflux protein
MVALGGLFVAVATASDSVYGIVAGTVRAWLASAPHRLERLGGAGGLMMIGLGTKLAVTGRRN